MSRAPRASTPVSPVPAGRSDGRLRVVLALLAAIVLYGVLESVVWPRTLWGAHALGFLPRPGLLLTPLALLALLSAAGRVLPGPRPPGRFARRMLPWLAGAVFWLARERHLFWGDALPLSLNVPQGQAFHPDEPLTL